MGGVKITPGSEEETGGEEETGVEGGTGSEEDTRSELVGYMNAVVYGCDTGLTNER